MDGTALAAFRVESQRFCLRQAQRNRLAALELSFIVKRIAPLRVTCFWLLLAGVAVCQGGNTEKTSAKTLPDAPSAQVLSPAIALERVVDEAKLPSPANAVDVNAKAVVETNVAHGAFELPPLTLHGGAPVSKQSTDFFQKHLYPSLLNPNARYHASESDKWMTRATDAASQILVTRDGTGRRRLNTSYLLSVAAAVASHSASRPYWLRSGSEPISDFGSTIGNDAGMNLLHEFGPGVRHAMTDHLPGFLFRIQEGIARQAGPRNANVFRNR